MALIWQDVLESLSGNVWLIRKGNGLTRLPSLTLTDVEGPDADCAEAATRELIAGGTIRVWLEDDEGGQHGFDLVASDFERAEDLMLDHRYELEPMEVYQTDLLLIACYGEVAYSKEMT